MISRVLDTIEKGMTKQQFAVDCFVNIASAFHELNAEKATQASKRSGIDSYIVDWYGDYLRHKYATVELIYKGSQKTVENKHRLPPRRFCGQSPSAIS